MDSAALVSFNATVGVLAPVPEPTSALLFVVGSLVVGGALRKKTVA